MEKGRKFLSYVACCHQEQKHFVTFGKNNIIKFPVMTLFLGNEEGEKYIP